MRQLFFLCILFTFSTPLFASELSEEAQELYEFYDIANNPYIPEWAGLRMAPYLLPPDHPAYENLDKRCRKSRVFYSVGSFTNAGFKRVAKKQSFLVGYHPKFPKWLVKGKPDVEKKRKRPLKGFINRARTSERMREVIADYQLEHVEVPRKWIYPLPLKPKPYESVEHPSVVVIVADRLNIEDLKTTRYLWRKESSWTAEMIEDLFILLYNVPLADCGLINVRFTKDHKKIAFFDLEYPGKSLDLVHRKLIALLPDKWQDYWYELLDAAEAEDAA